VKPKRTVVTFVQKDSSASALHLRSLAGQYGQEEGEQNSKVVVIDRANPRGTESLKNDLGLDFVMLADPTGKITDRFRGGVWPTTIKLDSHGIVLEVQIGVAGRACDDRTDAELPHQSHSAL
jgi:AhpC/TSA family